MNKRSKYVLMNYLYSLIVYLPMLIGAGIILSTKGPLSSFRAAIGFFIAGFTGIVMIIRKESPMALGIIRGKGPMIGGIIVTTLCWFAALAALFTK